MKLLDPEETVIVVTGATSDAEHRDVRMAQWLQAEIDRRGGGLTYRRAVLVGDERYVRTPAFHHNPTITIGGPGANDVAGHLTQMLPMVWTREEKSFIQMGLDGHSRQVALWGMDAEGTKGAVVAFVEQGMLDAMLERIWTLGRAGASH